MAVINLKVNLDSKNAIGDTEKLRKSVELIKTTLESVKPNKDLTTQIQSLTKFYKELANAVTKVEKAEKERAAAERTQSQTRLNNTRNEIAIQKELDRMIDREAKKQQEAARQVEKAEREAQKAGNARIKTLQQTEQQVTRLQREYNNLMLTINGKQGNYAAGTFADLKRQIIENQNALAQLDNEYRNGGLSAEEYSTRTQMLSNNLNVLKTQMSETLLNSDALNRSYVTGENGVLALVVGFAKWQVAATLVMKPIQLIRETIQSINETLQETEDTVIALQRVLPKGSASDSDISNQLYGLASQYGQQFQNVSEIATNFARTGMNWADTIAATEAALIAMNVAELDATQASDGLIAIMTQFGYTATDLLDIVDKLNKTADKFPVTSEKLLTAIQRTGSSARNANISLEETLGIITALSKATGRSGENLGTAVNSLIQYSGKESALGIFEQLSEKTADAVDRYRTGLGSILDVWKAVSEEMKDLDERQENLLKQLAESDDIQNLSEELHDALGDIFESQEDVFGTANTFRKNYFIALLDNMDTVLEATETAQNAIGYSQKENAEYMDTYTAKVNTLNAEWGKFANSFQSVLVMKKWLVELGTAFVPILTGLNKAGILLPTITGSIATLIAFGLAKRTMEINSSTAKLISNLIIGKTATDAETAAVAKYTLAQKRRVVAELEAAVAQGRLTVTEKDAIITELGLTNVNNFLGVSFKALRASMGTVGIALSAIGILASVLIPVIAQNEARINSTTERLDELNSEISETENKITDLKSKIAENNRLIEEANGIAGNEAYINRLTAENVELDRQLTLEKSLLQIKKEEAAKEAREKLTAKDYSYYTPAEIDSKYFAPIFDNAIDITTTDLPGWIEHLLQDAEHTGYVSDSLGEDIQTLNELRNELNLENEADKELFETTGDLIDRFNALMYGVNGATEATETNTNAVKEQADAAEEAAERIKQLNEQIDETQSAIKTLEAAQQEYNETGFLSVDTIQELLQLNPKYLALLFDENGQINLNKDAVNALVEAKKEELTQIAAENVATYALSRMNEILKSSQDDVATATGEAGNAADTLDTKIKTLTEDVLGGAMSFALYGKKMRDAFGIDNDTFHHDKATKEAISDIQNYAKNYQSIINSVGYTPSGTSTGKTSANAKTPEELELEARKARITLIKAQLSLLKEQGASDDEQIAKMRELVSAYDYQLEYMREIGSEEVDIVNTEKDRVSVLNDIQDIYDKQEEAKKKELEAAKKEYENRIAEIDSELSLLEKQGGSYEKQIELQKEKQRLLHEEAEFLRQNNSELKDINALSLKWLETSEKIVNLTKQWHFADDLATLEREMELLKFRDNTELEQIENLKEQLQLYKDEEEYLRSIGASEEDIHAILVKQNSIQQEIDNGYSNLLEQARKYETDIIQKQIDDLQKQRDTEKQQLDIEEKKLAVIEAQKNLLDAMNERNTRVYNAETGMWEWQANGNTIADAQKNYDTAKSAYSDALRDNVMQQLQARLNGTNTFYDSVANGTATYSDIRSHMMGNSAAWGQSSNVDGNRYQLHSYNEALGHYLGATYNPNGTWNRGSTALYDASALIHNALAPTDGAVYNMFKSNNRIASAIGTPLSPNTGGKVTNNVNTDSHDTNNNTYNVNGVPITENDAKSMTMQQIFEAIQILTK